MNVQRESDKVCEQLRDQVMNLLDDLLSICPNESDILMVRLFFENSVPSETLMKGFMKWVYPWKEYIERKDQRYFEENDHMFGPLPQDKVKYFKRKFQDGTFDKDDLETIWAYFSVFLKLMIKYDKLK